MLTRLPSLQSNHFINEGRREKGGGESIPWQIIRSVSLEWLNEALLVTHTAAVCSVCERSDEW